MPAPTSPQPSPSPASGGGAFDPAIPRRIRAGDEQAFARFYGDWFAPTLSLARAVSRRDEAFALDVVQDVMLTVANKLPALDGEAQLRAWMSRTVSNAVTDRLRAERRRQRREQHVAEQAAADDGEPWSALADRERQRWLSASVAELPLVEQQLLQARFGDVTSVAQAAADLGMTSNAAHGRLRRALDKLRQMAASVFHAER